MNNRSFPVPVIVRRCCGEIFCHSLPFIVHVALLHFPFSMQEIEAMSDLCPEIHVILAVPPNVDIFGSSSVAVPFVIDGRLPQSVVSIIHYIRNLCTGYCKGLDI